ncbi:hypothetical protein Sa4125_44450 [Aureimonas sp. SA4125]|nr:hypothetical protein Sa4125_44450 [Aureimonas sp. SA4125]
MQNQMVEICSRDGTTCQSQFTGSTGYFEFDGLQQGTYKLQTRGSDGGLLDSEVQVLPGEPKELSVIAR